MRSKTKRQADLRIRAVKAKNAKLLFRPMHFFGINVPPPTAYLTNFLRLIQQRLALSHLLLGCLATGAFGVDQGEVVLYDLAKLLDQALVCVRIGVALAIQDANRSERLGVRPKEREAEV